MYIQHVDQIEISVVSYVHTDAYTYIYTYRYEG